MLNLRGKEKLGEYKTIPVYIDWDYLAKEVGLRKEEEAFERSIGKFLYIGVIFYLIIITIFQFSSQNYFWISLLKVDSIIKLSVWGGFFLIIYAFYLTRNRDIYLDKLKRSSLADLIEDIEHEKEIKEINMTQYFDHDLLNLIDDILGEYDQNFLPELLSDLLKFPFVRYSMSRLGMKIESFIKIIDSLRNANDVNINTWIRPVLVESFFIGFKNHFEYVDELALFLYFCKRPLAKMLLDYEISKDEVESLELWMQNNARKKRYAKIFNEKSALKPLSTVNRAYTSRYSPTLVKNSRDFTAEVVRGDFTMSIARDKELQNLIDQVQEGDSSATLIIGEHGVGKTTLLKSLAVKMVVEDVPKLLQDMRLVSFDFNKAFALSPSLEKFKSIVEKVLEETAGAKNIILIIDDLDDLVNIRKEFAAEIINLITKAIDNYKMRIIATSTPEGYTRYIKTYQTLAAIFSTVIMHEPSDTVAVQILMDDIPALERKFGVKVAFETLVKTVKLSHNYDFDRVLPDKGIMLIEEAMVQAQNQRLTFITERLIEEIVSKKVGVEIGAIDKSEVKKLINLEEELHKRVIGQDAAVEAVAAALRRSRAGLATGNRPIASFLFFGPTGVGKTELAKAVTELYYGYDNLMIRVDMSEYQEEENLKRLIGHPEKGEFVGGFLTEAVREHPFSLVLLDEIEKANPKVLDLFLQVLDEGVITDGGGRKVNFKNTILIATSNIASKNIADLLEKGKNYDEVKEEVLPQIRQYLRVEFLNRFDRVIMFKPLSQNEVMQIAGLLMNKEKKVLDEKGIMMNFSQEVLVELTKLGYNPMYGARELRRVIQDKVEDKIANLIIEKKLKSGGELMIKSLEEFNVVK